LTKIKNRDIIKIDGKMKKKGGDGKWKEKK